LISILSQVVILRELSVAFYGIELIYILALGLWLLGTGLGALWRTSKTQFGGFNRLLILFTVLLVLDVVFIRGIRILFGGVPGGFLPFEWQLLGIAVAILPIGIILGKLFREAAKLYTDHGGSLAIAYGIESAGAAIGGLATTLLMLLALPNLAIGLLCAMAALLAAILYSISTNLHSRTLLPKISWLAVLLLLGFGAALARSTNLDLMFTRWDYPHTVIVRDTPYGRVTVAAHASQLSVYENGALTYENEGTAAEEFVHLAALQCESPARILMLGGGVEGLVREALRYHPDQLDCFQLNRRLFEAVKTQLPPNDRAALQDECVSFRFGDPRELLQTAGIYDLIFVGMPDPATAQSNRFYTTEFFESVRQHLSDSGIVAFRLRSAENYWSPQLIARNAGIVKSLDAVFVDRIILPGTVNIITASNLGLERDINALTERFQQRSLTTRLVTPDYIRYLYRNDRIATMEDQLVGDSVQPNTDKQPVCFHYAVSIWLSKFYPRLLGPNRSPSEKSVIGISLLLILLMAGGGWSMRNRRRLRLALLVGWAGFAGMLLETVLLMQYQIKCGVLYQNLGLLLMLFMLGMAVGPITTESLLKRIQSRTNKPSTSRILGFSIAFMFALLSVGVALSIGTDRMNGLVPIGTLLVASGFWVGAMFTYTAGVLRNEVDKPIGPLYAADLAGGAIATIAGVLLWIPLLGLSGTAIIGSLAILVSAILI
ncbi:MAG: hypothetical protein ACOZB3_03525, partial [Calditrichota bacterium]